MKIQRTNSSITPGDKQNLIAEIQDCLASVSYHADFISENNNYEYTENLDEISRHKNTYVEKVIVEMFNYAVNGVWSGGVYQDHRICFAFLLASQSRAAHDYLWFLPNSVEPILIESVINKFFSRLKLDYLTQENFDDPSEYAEEVYVDGDYSDGLTVAEIALLSSMQFQSVYNVIGKPEGLKRRPNNTGKIAVICPKSAKHWLERKEAFIKTSIEGEEEVLINVDKKTALVPIARDGTVFDSSCIQKSGFTIGKKGDEYRVIDYKQAISELRKMQRPYWRRPNTKGKFGIVSGIKWEEKSLAELGIESLI